MSQRALPTGTVTFLFTDIEGSTRLAQAVGDGFAGLVDRHHSILRTAIADHQGVVVSTEGDAFFAVFRDPRRAVGAAAAAQRALVAEPWPAAAPLRVRMGVHTGEGRLGGDDYVGIDVNRAARIASAAHGGQVLLSRVTADHVREALPDGLALRELGEVRLKDFDRFESIAQLDIGGLTLDFPPLRAERPGWLPEPLSSFLGRTTEIEVVDAFLERHRMVTLTGPGGIGKTRLSIEVARRARERFQGGAWFVPLEAIRDPDLVLPEVAVRLEVREDPQRPLLSSLAARVAERPTLLVLDNLEQVVGVGGELGRLLLEAPTLRVLASSREALRVSGEQEYPVPDLGPDLGVRLFLERARQVRPGLAMDGDDERIVRAIVERLDRMPLAIELAAARVRLFPPRALLERLGRRLEMLSGGASDVPDRQRTLRGAIDWSHELLTEHERSVFARLSVFSGGADLRDVEAVLDLHGGPGTLEALDSLADKSLVRLDVAEAGEPRLAMLETIREYAAERLSERDDAEAVRERHALHYLAVAEQVGPELTGPRPGEAADRVDRDHDNLRAAIAWSLEQGRPAIGLRIGGAIWRFWQFRSHMVEGRERLEALLAVTEPAPDPLARGRGLTALGGVRYWLGDYAGAREAYEEALARYREARDEAGIALALYDLSFPVVIAGDTGLGAELQRESLERYTELGDQVGVALVKEASAVIALMDEDFERARELQSAVVATWRATERPIKLSDSLSLLTVIEARRGDAAAARRAINEKVRVIGSIEDRSATAGILQIGAIVALAEDRVEVAARLLGALQTLRDRGQPFLTPVEVLRQPDPDPLTRARLGERFDLVFGEGRSMSTAAAISLAATGPETVIPAAAPGPEAGAGMG